MGSNQKAKDTIVKWQERRKDWAHYVVRKVIGHREIKSSSYSEQNHSSLAARVPDDHSRPIERFITEVIRRTGDIMDERQKALFTWDANKATAVDNMIPRDRPHLKSARGMLYQVPYERFVGQYKCYSSYNVVEVEGGCHITHTSSPALSAL